jgi:hypothetical protein
MSHRRISIDPLDSNTKTSKLNLETVESDHPAQPDITTKKRFLPQPVETSTRSNRVRAVNPTTIITPKTTDKLPPTASEEAVKPRRKFIPQLIESSSSKGLKRANDGQPTTIPTDKARITSGTNDISLPARKPNQQSDPTLLSPKYSRSSSPHTRFASSNTRESSPFTPRRQNSMKPHLNTRQSTREDFHSEVEIVLSAEESLEDNQERDFLDEDTPSLSGSFGSSEDSHTRLQMAQTRESCDERFSGYLLSLAAKAAQEQLREQELAAFPNSDYHDPVEHFFHESEPSSDEDDAYTVGLLPHEMVGKRKSTDVGFTKHEMEQHQDTLARMREEETLRKLAEEAMKPTFHDPFWTNGTNHRKSSMHEEKAEVKAMRDAASPPMLGGNLKFRMHNSPKATIIVREKKEMQPHSDDGHGLWGGYCVAEEPSQYITPFNHNGPDMISTPHNELEDPFSKLTFSDSNAKKIVLKGVHMVPGIDERLKAEVEKAKQEKADAELEDALLAEFTDDFVTQVYNYLSLGYPALGNFFDEELSHITSVPENSLSRDDCKDDPWGHIGLEQGTGRAGSTLATAEGLKSPRWQALKIYIYEWARQHPNMSDQSSEHAWGVRARRGSWAI